MKRSGFTKKEIVPLKRTGFKRKDPMEYLKLRENALLRLSEDMKINPGKYSLRGSTLKAERTVSKVLSNGQRIWSDMKADSEFSNYVRLRDGQCLCCGSKQKLTCSHFHGRSHSATRYDPKNCIVLCLYCHSIWEDQKHEGQTYYRFMIGHIGLEEMEFLNARAQSTVKRNDCIIECMRFLESLNLSMSSIN